MSRRPHISSTVLATLLLLASFILALPANIPSSTVSFSTHVLSPVADDVYEDNFPMSFPETLAHNKDDRSVFCSEGIKVACNGAASSSCSASSCKICCNGCCKLVNAPLKTTCDATTPIERFNKGCEDLELDDDADELKI